MLVWALREVKKGVMTGRGGGSGGEDISQGFWGLIMGSVDFSERILMEI